MPREYDEKRDFIRINVDCEMSYKLPDDAETKSGKVTNLSGRGMMFITEEALEFESLVEVRIIPEKNITPPLHANVRIVRVAKQRHGDGYETGAVIQEILDD
ncbi:MAG: PilZ domain-containing protein [Gammaproteobacteria bacterium]|nr:PilZ domain-containing protein [Gammaproteobacteria bacterium]